MLDSPAAIVSVDAVSYSYPKGSRQVLSRVTLTVQPGEFVAVMGRTGAGKTTLLSLLNGLIPQFFDGDMSGSVTVAGLNSVLYRVQTLSRRVGVVLQDTEAQIVGMTVEKDVAFGPCNLGFSPAKVRQNVRQALALVGLAGFEQRSPAQLSGGEKQRLAIAGVLAMEPTVLVLDEPTSELDPMAREQFFELCASLRRSGAYTIIMTTHDSTNVIAYADRVLVIDNGGIVWEGLPRNLFSNPAQCRSFGLQPPQVTELVSRLKARCSLPVERMPLTVKEAMPIVLSVLQDRFPSRDTSPLPERTRSRELPVIEVQDLHFSYSNMSEVLKGVSLSIQEGEFIAVVGKNGAGKSTLVKHLNGLLRPSSGKVLVDGVDARGNPTSVLSRSVGYVFQNPDHQIFCPSVREELEFGLRSLASLPEREIGERVRSSLEFVGLERYAARHPFTLGKGERQKLAVASVLAVEPKVLVIDEPSTGLDCEGTERMMQLIRRLHQRGHTIIIITHDMQLVAEYAERMIVMSDGKIVADGTPHEVFLNPHVPTEASLTVPPMAALSMFLRTREVEVGCISVAEFEDAIAGTMQGLGTNAH